MLTNFRELGVAAGILYVLARMLEAISIGRVRLYAYHLVAQPVSDIRVFSRRGRGIQVREVGLDEAIALPVERPRTIIEARFQQGARCLVASADDKFLGFLWFTVGPYEDDEVRCRFVPGPRGVASWDFDVFVEPSARLGFAFARLWDEANQVLSRLGVKWSISRISAFNPGSLSSHRRLGSVRVARAGFICAGPLQLMFATTRPYVHVALRSRSRATLQVCRMNGPIRFDQKGDVLVIDDVKRIVGTTLQLGPRMGAMNANTPLLGAIPELDSMAVVSLITALEERFGISVDDDEIGAATFETLGSLAKFVEQKLAG